MAQLRLGVGLNWGGSVETGGRARLGVAHLRLGENLLRLKMSQLKLLPLWAYSACSANEYEF